MPGMQPVPRLALCYSRGNFVWRDMAGNKPSRGQQFLRAIICRLHGSLEIQASEEPADCGGRICRGYRNDSPTKGYPSGVCFAGLALASAQKNFHDAVRAWSHAGEFFIRGSADALVFPESGSIRQPDL